MLTGKIQMKKGMVTIFFLKFIFPFLMLTTLNQCISNAMVSLNICQVLSDIQSLQFNVINRNRQLIWRKSEIKGK